MDLVVLGAGESGVGTAVLAHIKGLKVWVSDFGKIADKYKNVLLHHSIQFEENGHSEALILEANEIVKSPGIPPSADIIVKAKEKGIPVISEIEFAARYTKAKLIGITGSNGKTTTTLLCNHILKNAGLNVGVAGNVGSSFARQVAEETFDYYVLELSSFQLDDMFNVKLDIAILLNITPDHLDRYDYDFEKYCNSKFRIIQNQDSECHFIYWDEDSAIQSGIAKRDIKAKSYPFSQENEFMIGAFLNENKQIQIQTNKQQNNQFTMSIHDLALQGKHNVNNTMAAGIAARVLEIRKDIIRESLSDFQNVEHRLEFVARIHGIEFINDSKATNVNSTWYALESINKPIVWIAGGVDKGNDYSSVMELVKSKVHTLICLGTDNEKLKKTFEGTVDNIVEASNADDAVALAYQYARKDEVVIMSPACASFDLFENYEERGNQFKRAVKAL